MKKIMKLFGENGFTLDQYNIARQDAIIDCKEARDYQKKLKKAQKDGMFIGNPKEDYEWDECNGRIFYLTDKYEIKDSEIE